MKKVFLYSLVFLFAVVAKSQTAKTMAAAEIKQQLNKLSVFGSVLYIAAHPDDENTRLLSYFASQRQYRTGYLSLTRGDGGQNLIGKELGVDLGLIRTQELLAARRTDGAEQFFTRAFDFGFSKSPEETLEIWDKQKVLADVVWVIRTFKPDVIIARFPTTGEGGHGHHTASALLAQEAFDLAANPNAFPEQLNQTQIWQAQYLFWNTFNFGGNNTTRADQLKFDVGGFNPYLGASYGEIAALSRSQHKSQGFGVPAQRGSYLEYFKQLKGTKVTTDVFENINTTWQKLNNQVNQNILTAAQNKCKVIQDNFDMAAPQKSVKDLVDLYSYIDKNIPIGYWQTQKLTSIKNCIAACAGLHVDATTEQEHAVIGDSITVTLSVINRLADSIFSADCKIDETYVIFDQLKINENATKKYRLFVGNNYQPSQPYWLQQPLNNALFTVNQQTEIGLAEKPNLTVDFSMMIYGKEFIFTIPISHKYTDPVKGEIYQPLSVIPTYFVGATPNVVLYNTNKQNNNVNVTLNVQANKAVTDSVILQYTINGAATTLNSYRKTFTASQKLAETFSLKGLSNIAKPFFIYPQLVTGSAKTVFNKQQNKINYDHIPNIQYTFTEGTKVVPINLQIVGKKIGYIIGAGDKVVPALEQMGYTVTFLTEADCTLGNLQKFDAIITGVRAYNTNDWLNNVHTALMQYIFNGGVLVNQYCTSSNLGPLVSKMGPYNFNITRNRVTDETAPAVYTQPTHTIFNYPNKITAADFNNWVQERSIYHADKLDTNYVSVLNFTDRGETQPQPGSLIVANYGKGKYVYTGLAFFRQLPAGVPGAYRLLANILAKNK
jgi:LmbE family N-acetylglucosaminyl deacetylase